MTPETIEPNNFSKILKMSQFFGHRVQEPKR